MKRVDENKPFTYHHAVDSISKALSTSYKDPYIYALSVISYVTRMDKQSILINMDNYLSKKQKDMVSTLEDKLIRSYPLSYILGNIDFYKENYIITESVLIPRPETELIVEEAITFVNKFNKNRKSKILEIGTGSGCISISILNNIKNIDVQIVATDISESALKIAQRNVNINLQKSRRSRIIFVEQDILTELPSECFDLIISNPPYIPLDEYKKLEKSLYFEPEIALTDFSNGLRFYKRLALSVKNNLNTGGMAIFEIHSMNTENTLKVFKEILGKKTKLMILKDTFGRARFLKILT
ncbi:MAG TPA: peptide chain release factor N(5)-glutamine methyltransferase [Candidatus Dojkabacteria bacterium]|mgnify:CR=1 FL=1|nr:peptide chain release factor N(5)-glutamine methyltransferase [Candidatus Dojkabacteria bacterium]HRO65296.1 peptide chain release factor N(5)-glutamine methyltransferase [Candidatus Dojkabacteria bacterium]HRP36207.1 peptide chain release factor N(5)-glutamine methyltransferase [Candidatus Dojkabacteria bacterium]HRP51577.1 peptide chain release factor N(5)-glutamine methyltransferase [Candidatus Dojkabacteria bacterium]